MCGVGAPGSGGSDQHPQWDALHGHTRACAPPCICVQVTPGAPGLFHLVMSGTRAQLEAAQKLVSSVIG